MKTEEEIKQRITELEDMSKKLDSYGFPLLADSISGAIFQLEWVLGDKK